MITQRIVLGFPHFTIRNEWSFLVPSFAIQEGKIFWIRPFEISKLLFVMFKQTRNPY